MKTMMLAAVAMMVGCGGAAFEPADDAGTDGVPPWCYEVPGAQGCPHTGCTALDDAGAVVSVPCP